MAAKTKPKASSKRELLGLFLLALGLLEFFALVSYDARDPSLNATGHGPIHNWIGPSGAYFADLMHQLLGIGAYGLAWIPVAFGVAVLIGRDLRHVMARLGAFLLLVVSGAALAQFCLEGKSGGLLGGLLVVQLGHIIGQVGAAIVLIMSVCGARRAHARRFVRQLERGPGWRGRYGRPIRRRVVDGRAEEIQGRCRRASPSQDRGAIGRGRGAKRREATRQSREAASQARARGAKERATPR